MCFNYYWKSITFLLISSHVTFKASFEVLSSDYLDAVYDLTIAYSNVSESPVPRKPAPSMTGKLVWCQKLP